MKKLLSLAVMALSLVAFTSSALVAQTAEKKKARITTPAGVVVEVQETTAGSGVFEVTGIVKTVAGKEIVATSGPLIGATVSGVAVTGTGLTVGTLTFTPAGSSTPLTSTQVVSAMQTMINTAVTAAVSAGTLPPGTTAPTITGSVTTGTAALAGGGGGPQNVVGNNNNNNPDNNSKNVDVATGSNAGRG
jgi:hypothetical protein